MSTDKRKYAQCAFPSRIEAGVIFALLATLSALVACGGKVSPSDNSIPATTIPAGLNLSLVPARTSGVAPLAVFFDATGTTDGGVTTHPFHDIEYAWNFGDPVSGTAGTWASGAQAGASSKNTATGPVSAHVFETPGTYTVALTAFDGSNTATTSTTITVADPDVVFAGTNTICIGATSLPVGGVAGCPAYASAAQQSDFTAAIAAYALTGKRVLFKRGDTFVAATSANLVHTGPGIVGSFGTGALPVIQMTGNTTALGFSSRSTPAFSDWRVMDLEFDGMRTANSTGVGIGSGNGGVTQVTTLRLTLRNFETSIGFGGDLINWWNNNPGGPGTTGHIIDQLAIVDSTVIYGLNTSYGGYNAGNRVAFMGNNIDNGGVQQRYDENGNPIMNGANPLRGSHVTRFGYLGKAVISNNTLSRPGFDRLHIKLHAPTWVAGVPDSTGSSHSAAESGDGYTKQVVISDNRFIDFANPWSVSVSPQDSASDERIRDVILERNVHVTTATSQAAYRICARQVTVRNNLYQGGGANGQSLALINVDGAEPPAGDIWVYNNTQYSADPVPSNQFTMVVIGDARVSSIYINNNLAYAPNALGPLLYSNVGASNVVASNNSTDSQVKNSSPLFTATPPVLLTDWQPTTGSYAINAGAVVPVWSDFFRVRRPQNGANDLGAFEIP